MSVSRLAIIVSLAVLTAACQQQGAGGGGASSGSAQASAAAPDRTADEAAIKDMLANAYNGYAVSSEKGIWQFLTPEFSQVWQDCLAMQERLNQANKDGEVEFGSCMDDAGSLVPGQDYDGKVAARTQQSTVSWLGPDSALAHVTMKYNDGSPEEGAVDLALSRTAQGWRIADIVDKQLPKGGYRASLADGMAEMRTRTGGQ